MKTDREYVLVTGATGAIGRQIAKSLYLGGENLILACRNGKRSTKLIEALKKQWKGDPSQAPDLRWLQLDLADERSVVESANAISSLKIKGLINNAGVMCRHFTTLTSGLETTMGVNFAATAVFTELIRKRMAPGSVIVFTTSLTRFLWRPDQETRANLRDGIITNRLREVTAENFSQLGTYGLSKRLLTDYAAALSRRLESQGIRVNCADPGIVDTGMIHMERWYDRLADLLFRPFIRKPRHGAIPALRAYASPRTGLIFCRFLTHKV